MENDDQQNKFNEYGLIYGALLIACCLTLFRCWFSRAGKHFEWSYVREASLFQWIVIASLVLLVGLFAVIQYTVYSTRSWRYRTFLGVTIFTAVIWAFPDLSTEKPEKLVGRLGLTNDNYVYLFFFFVPVITVGMISRVVGNTQLIRWKNRADAIQFAQKNPSGIQSLYMVGVLVLFMYAIAKTTSLFSDEVIVRIQLQRESLTLAMVFAVVGLLLSLFFVATARIQRSSLAAGYLLFASVLVFLPPWGWSWVAESFELEALDSDTFVKHSLWITLIAFCCYILTLAFSRTLPFSYSLFLSNSRNKKSQAVEDSGNAELQRGNRLVAPVVLIGFALCVWLIPQSEFLRNQLIQLALPN